MLEQKPVGSHVIMGNGEGTVVAGFVVGYKKGEMIVEIGNNGFVFLDSSWHEVE